MSAETPDTGLPSTTARTIVLAGLVGVLALAVRGPTALVGVVVGLAFAVTSRGFAGSHRRVAVAAATLPAVALGAVVGVASGTGPVDVFLTLAGAIVGLGLGYTRASGPTASALSQARTAALVAALAAAAVAILAHWVSTAGGVEPVLETVLWLEYGTAGLLGWLLVAGFAVAGAVLVIPPAAMTAPRRWETCVRHQHALVRTIAFGTAVLAALVIAASLVGRYVPALEYLLAGVASSRLVRGLLAAVGLAALAALVFVVVVRHSWLQTRERGNAIVPILVGASVGVGACALAAAVVVPIVDLVDLGARGGSDWLVAALFGATAATLGVGWLAMAVHVGARASTPIGGPGPVSAIAAGLAVGGVAVAVAATGDAAPTGTDALAAGLPSLVALAAGLFVYDVGRYGRALADEIGATGASKQPQVVRCCWSGAVAAVGVCVAAGGLWLATVAAPTLSVPATVGVLAAVAAVVVGARLLLR